MADESYCLCLTHAGSHLWNKHKREISTSTKNGKVSFSCAYAYAYFMPVPTRLFLCLCLCLCLSHKWEPGLKTYSQCLCCVVVVLLHPMWVGIVVWNCFSSCCCVISEMALCLIDTCSPDCTSISTEWKWNIRQSCSSAVVFTTSVSFRFRSTPAITVPCRKKNEQERKHRGRVWRQIV